MNYVMNINEITVKKRNNIIKKNQKRIQIYINQQSFKKRGKINFFIYYLLSFHRRL